MKLTKIRSLPLGLVALATIAVLITVSASPRLLSIAAAPPAPPTPAVPVTVVNTPLSVTGSVGVTGNVNAAVTGNVNASVTGTVAVTNTPTVNFSNSATTPIYVDTDRSARNAFIAACSTGPVTPSSPQVQCSPFLVPPSSTAVIETVACTAEVAPGLGIGQALLVVPSATNAPINIPLAMTNQTNNLNESVEIWAMTSQVRIYAFGANLPGIAGSPIWVNFGATAASLTTGAPQGMNCVISGYVVPQ